MTAEQREKRRVKRIGGRAGGSRGPRLRKSHISVYATRVKNSEGHASPLDAYLMLVPESKTQNGSSTKSLGATANHYSSTSLSALPTKRGQGLVFMSVPLTLTHGSQMTYAIESITLLLCYASFRNMHRIRTCPRRRPLAKPGSLVFHRALAKPSHSSWGSSWLLVSWGLLPIFIGSRGRPVASRRRNSAIKPGGGSGPRAGGGSGPKTGRGRSAGSKDMSWLLSSVSPLDSSELVGGYTTADRLGPKRRVLHDCQPASSLSDCSRSTARLSMPGSCHRGIIRRG